MDDIPTLDDRSGKFDGEMDAERVRQWSLPTEPDAFLAWLRISGTPLETFMTYPAAQDMPASLRKALGL